MVKVSNFTQMSYIVKIIKILAIKLSMINDRSQKILNNVLIIIYYKF